MNPFDGLLGVAAAILLAYVLLVLGLRTVRHARRAGEVFSARFAAPFVAHFAESETSHRFRALNDEVDRALGSDPTADAADRAGIFEAASAAQRIAIVNRLLRKSAAQCLQTHWAVADGLGANEMGQAARHPASARLRQRVIDLVELLSHHIERYPLLNDAPDLLKLGLGVRWLAPSCANCPYFTSTRESAPAVCPTVAALGTDGRRRRTNQVIDGELC